MMQTAALPQSMSGLPFLANGMHDYREMILLAPQLLGVVAAYKLTY
jgi:hypothetical protein